MKSGKYFPCKKCGAHFLKRLATKPLNISSRAGITQYLCQLHNEVNVITNKTLFDCENNLTNTYGGKCGCEEDEEASKNTNNTKIEKNTTIQNNTSILKNKEDEVNSTKTGEIPNEEKKVTVEIPSGDKKVADEIPSEEKKVAGETEKKEKEKGEKKEGEV